MKNNRKIERRTIRRGELERQIPGAETFMIMKIYSAKKQDCRYSKSCEETACAAKQASAVRVNRPTDYYHR